MFLHLGSSEISETIVEIVFVRVHLTDWHWLLVQCQRTECVDH